MAIPLCDGGTEVVAVDDVVGGGVEGEEHLGSGLLGLGGLYQGSEGGYGGGLLLSVADDGVGGQQQGVFFATLYWCGGLGGGEA